MEESEEGMTSKCCDAPIYWYTEDGIGTQQESASYGRCTTCDKVVKP